MKQFQQKFEIIKVNDVAFPLELFMKMNPDYECVEYRLYIPEQTHTIIEGGTQRSGPIDWKEGDKYIRQLKDLHYLQAQEELDDEERQVIVEREKHDALPYGEKRKKEYPLIEDLVVSMWEHLVKKNPTLKNGFLEQKRQEIKNKYPKPD